MYSYAYTYQHTYVCEHANACAAHIQTAPPHPLQHTNPLTPPHYLTLGVRACTHTHKHTQKSGWLPIHVQFVGLSHELVKISQFFVREMVVRRKVGADALKDLRIDCFRGHAVPEGALVDAVLAK
jgi:hypothetical protein